MKKILGLCVLSISLSSFANSEYLYAYKDHLKGFTNNVVEIGSLENKSNQSKSFSQIKNEMMATGLYKFVERNTKQYEASDDISDMNLSGGWHHMAIDTQGAQKLIQNPKNVVVAVCDSGYEENHPDLIGRSVPGYSFVGSSSDTSANTHHGTMVSGLIVGHYNKAIGTVGIAPFVKVMPMRITTSRGSTDLKTIVNCIKMSADRGAKVINVSFTGVNNQSIEEAGAYAAKLGSLVVYSAGNQGKNRRKYPDHKNIFIVGGTQESGRRWNCNKRIWRFTFKRCGSNYGNFVDAVAPARNVLTTRASITFGGDNYSTPNGTSFSAPIVSAVAALIYSVNPNFSAEDVTEILKQSAIDIGSDYVYGAGIINAKRAVEIAIKNS